MADRGFGVGLAGRKAGADGADSSFGVDLGSSFTVSRTKRAVSARGLAGLGECLYIWSRDAGLVVELPGLSGAMARPCAEGKPHASTIDLYIASRYGARPELLSKIRVKCQDKDL